jgi:hypothetical protein
MSKHFDRVNNRIRPANDYAETRPTVYRAEEHAPAPMVMESAGASQGYDSLLSYWHMLVGHKTTLLCFALAGWSARSFSVYSRLRYIAPGPPSKSRTSIRSSWMARMWTPPDPQLLPMATPIS